MTDRLSVKFQPNVPKTVTLAFDQPRTGENEYGPWYLYGCQFEGQDASFFASDPVHEIIQSMGYRKGHTIDILKAVDEEDKTTWSVNGIGWDDIKQTPENGTGEDDMGAYAATTHKVTPKTKTADQKVNSKIEADVLEIKQAVSRIALKINELLGELKAWGVMPMARLSEAKPEEEPPADDDVPF